MFYSVVIYLKLGHAIVKLSQAKQKICNRRCCNDSKSRAQLAETLWWDLRSGLKQRCEEEWANIPPQ